MPTKTQKDITEIYIASFNRAPDNLGLLYWNDKVEQENWSIDDVAKSFFDSQEAAQKYPTTLSDENFLNTIYNNVLGRDGEKAGMTYWLEQMQKGITREQMIPTILNGAKADTGDANDKLFLQNRTEVGTYFALTQELNDTTTAQECLKIVTAEPSSVDTSKDYIDIYKYSQDDTISLILGDEADNTLNGTDTTDYIYAKQGNDLIYAGDGDNQIVAGSGIDTIYTGAGNDTIQGRSGDDTAYTSDGDDTIYGDEGSDSLHAGAGNDTLYGGDGDDYMYGYEGDDLIYGGTGDDLIKAGEGNDHIYAQEGDDSIYAKDGENFIDGGSGNDIIQGGLGTDHIYGGSGNDTIYGLEQSDTLDGLTGNDLIYGGSGDDIINGNEGDDTLIGGEGNDTIDGELGEDTLYGGLGADTLTGGMGKDTFIFAPKQTTLLSLDTIIDFTFTSSGTDKIALKAQGSELTSPHRIDVSSSLTLEDAANKVTAADASTDARVYWFIYEDNTYIVEDLSSQPLYQESQDIIIKLQGIINLDGLNTHTIIYQ